MRVLISEVRGGEIEADGVGSEKFSFGLGMIDRSATIDDLPINKVRYLKKLLYQRIFEATKYIDRATW